MRQLFSLFLASLILLVPSAVFADRQNELSFEALFGTWRATHFVVNETGMVYMLDSASADGLSIHFADEESIVLRVFANGELEQNYPYHWTQQENKLILHGEDDIEILCECSLSQDELQIISGATTLFLTRESDEDAMLEAQMTPRLQPGDISNAKIDYGTSGHFTQEQIDSAMTVVLNRFKRYLNCELHTLSYSSDEWSEQEFNYYRHHGKEGVTYVDGMVLLSSFHTPPEEKSDHSDGFNPDYEYSGWNWILLLTDKGTWDLITWGY